MHAWSAILALPLLIHWQGVHFSAPFSGIEHHLGSRDIVPFLVPASADPCTCTVTLYWAVHVCLPKPSAPLGVRLRGQFAALWAPARFRAGYGLREFRGGKLDPSGCARAPLRYHGPHPVARGQSGDSSKYPLMTCSRCHFGSLVP